MDTHSSVITGLRDGDRPRCCRPRVVLLTLCLFSLLSVAAFSLADVYRPWQSARGHRLLPDLQAVYQLVTKPRPDQATDGQSADSSDSDVDIEDFFNNHRTNVSTKDKAADNIDVDIADFFNKHGSNVSTGKDAENSDVDIDDMFHSPGINVSTKDKSAQGDILSTNNNFRLKFMAWDNAVDYHIGKDVGDEKNGYFAFLCDHKFLCGGWADQLKGFMISYLIANLTKRAFRASVTRLPCNVNPIYLVPNKVNWTTPLEFGAGSYSSKKYLRTGFGSFRKALETANLTKYFDHRTKYLFLRSNLECISSLMKSKVYEKELSWTQNLTPADVYAAVYKRLFKLSPHLKNRLNAIISANLPTLQHRLVCIHIRLGHGAFSHDHQTRNSIENLPRIWSFMESKSRSKLDRVFVMSDSQAVLESARNQTFADRLITIPGDIVHVDKFYMQHQSANVACRGFEKLLLEHHLMMNCDVMVRGHSGLSVIASLVRGSDKDLYCLQDNGTIFPCVRNDFSVF